MKMGDIEKGFYALLHVSVLADQTEGISNKYRMPQKCTLPRRGWGGLGPGSAHLNTIFIMPWPHKVISLEFWWLARTCCQVQLSKRGMISPNGSLAPSFLFFHFITLKHPISLSVAPLASKCSLSVPLLAAPCQRCGCNWASAQHDVCTGDMWRGQNAAAKKEKLPLEFAYNVSPC